MERGAALHTHRGAGAIDVHEDLRRCDGAVVADPDLDRRPALWIVDCRCQADGRLAEAEVLGPVAPRAPRTDRATIVAEDVVAMAVGATARVRPVATRRDVVRLGEEGMHRARSASGQGDVLGARPPTEQAHARGERCARGARAAAGGVGAEKRSALARTRRRSVAAGRERGGDVPPQCARRRVGQPMAPYVEHRRVEASCVGEVLVPRKRRGRRIAGPVGAGVAIRELRRGVRSRSVDEHPDEPFLSRRRGETILRPARRRHGEHEHDDDRGQRVVHAVLSARGVPSPEARGIPSARPRAGPAALACSAAREDA